MADAATGLELCWTPLFRPSLRINFPANRRSAKLSSFSERCLSTYLPKYIEENT